MISMKWVSDYVDIKDEDLNVLADKITKAGVNVEHVITNHIDKLVIGKVIECENHPDSDHLHVCKVDVKNEILQIVCGAPNVREGLKVIVALPGAILPENFEIKKSKIRGIESNGMLCALFELGLEEKTEENYDKGIEELSSDAPIGENPIKYLDLEDTLYDLDIHKHKNNDCTNHIGFAYEVGTILGKKVTLPSTDYKCIDDNINNHFKLSVETENCSYYKSKMVTDLKIEESPEFIKKRLVSAGMRSINNIVDISNYVMLEFGQPLHFFDKEKLGNEIVVRMAKENEKVRTLDSIDRVLNEKDIVITDGNRVVAIAGVMGAENTDVDKNTKTVLIESAIFSSNNIRHTERHLNLRSEASMRYEKGLNYEYTNMALDRACHLLEKYANGKVLDGEVLYDNEDKKLKKINFTTEKINSILGINMTNEDIKNELNKLGFEFTLTDNLFSTIIPRRRLDIEENVSDIAEELGRLYGYHNLKNTLPNLPTKKGGYSKEVILKKIISKRLRTLGLNEVRTYSLVDEKSALMVEDNKMQVKVPNPMSKDKSYLRKNIVSSLFKVVDYNKSRNLKDIMIYEVGKTFFNDFEEENKMAILLTGNYMENNITKNYVKTDFYILKGMIENLLNYLGFKNRYSFKESTQNCLHPGISADIMLDREKIGFMGKIHPSIRKDDIYVAEISIDKLDIKTKPLKYKAGSIYPSIKKDLAFVVDNSVKAEEIEKIIKHAGTRILKSIEVFDVYTGEKLETGKKSLAFNLVFEDDNRTLTDEEVTAIFNNIIKEVEEKLDAKLRNM